MSRRPSERQSAPRADSAISGRIRKSVPKSRARDGRIERTHRLLHQALVELIHERGWDAITVRDVCERADVGRSTFYVHFADKEDLLVSGFGHLRERLRRIVGADPARPLAFTQALLEHPHEYEPVYRALLGRRTAQVVYRTWIEVVSGLLDEDLQKLVPARAPRSAAVRYLAGAMWELLSWWSERPSRASTVDVADTYRRLTMAVVRELGE
jgi:AcrR family transcriptional regulator